MRFVKHAGRPIGHVAEHTRRVRNATITKRALEDRLASQIDAPQRRTLLLEKGQGEQKRIALITPKNKILYIRGGGRSESEGSIEFPPASGFELAAAVRRSELEGCTCLETWVKRRM